MNARCWVTDRSSVPVELRDALGDAGSVVTQGFELPEEPWALGDLRWVRWGVVAGDAELAQAVLAVARGVGVAVACPDPELRGRLVEDLERLGPVDLAELGPDPLDVLDDDQRLLLTKIATGHTVASAADALFLSTRTAERRLSATRKLLGVRTTAEAIAVAQDALSVQDLLRD
jgi:hypothetical protein